MPSLVKALLCAVTFSLLVFACARPAGTPPYSATGFASISGALPFTEAKVAALKEAEKKARDQILTYALQLTYANGQTLETAAIQDAFVRAKVYDTIRTAKIMDQTIDAKAKTVTVTVQMDQQTLLQIVK